MIKVFDGKFSQNFIKVCILAYEISKDEYLQNHSIAIENATKETFFDVIIAPKHLFLALSIYPDSLAYSILSKFKKINKIFDANLEERIKASMKEFGGDFNLIKAKFNVTSNKILENLLMLAASYDHFYIGTEHLLYGLLKSDDSELVNLISNTGLNVEEVSNTVMGILKSISNFADIAENSNVNLGNFSKKTPALDYFATELTDEEKQKEIDPVILREKEIDRLVYILSRRYKNNPILLGNAGVGKTAIVEGLAKRIANNEVPDALIGKKIYNLDLNSVVAGASFRGEFETRLKDIIEEVNSDPNIILFIDEIHSIVGAGSNNGTGDAANILKPALAKSKVKIIGATTFEEYKQFIEKDAALERRFQPVFVNEPSTEDAIKLLSGIKENYEDFHNVNITDEAIESAVRLSKRYITDKYLPDKAIDLIDEACARMKVKNTNNSSVKDILKLRKTLEKLDIEKDILIEKEDFEEVIKIKDKIAELSKKLKKLESQNNKNKKKVGIVDVEDIVKIVSDITSVPEDNILHNNIASKIKSLKDELDKSIIGQEEIKESIVSYIKRGVFESNFREKPLASFLFVGKTGVGKSEVARILARSFFDKEENFLRFDMSEYSENIGITSLIGAPAGYVGYRETGVLTDSIKKKPYSVVMFDNIDKAHPKVLSLIQEILDSGYVNDATGKKINFKNTVIIMSVSVSNEMANEVSLGFETVKDKKEKQEKKNKNEKDNLEDVLEDYFATEFTGKVDKVLMFDDLDEDDLRDIARIKINDLSKYLSEKCVINVSDEALKHIAKESIKKNIGARGVETVVFDEVENKIIDIFIDNNDLSKIKELNIGFDKEITIKIK